MLKHVGCGPAWTADWNTCSIDRAIQIGLFLDVGLIAADKGRIASTPTCELFQDCLRADWLTMSKKEGQTRKQPLVEAIFASCKKEPSQLLSFEEAWSQCVLDLLQMQLRYWRRERCTACG